MGRGMKAGKRPKPQGMGGGNMQKQLQQVQAMQRQMEQIQAELEERIHRLETMMRNAKIINEDEVTGEYVNVGLRVTVEDVDSKENMDFIIVGSTEADPFAEPAKISNESEVGKNLLGKKIGETVEITVPDGILHYRVTAISKE